MVFFDRAVFLDAGILQWVEYHLASPERKASSCTVQGCITFWESLYFLIVTVRWISMDWRKCLVHCKPTAESFLVATSDSVDERSRWDSHLCRVLDLMITIYRRLCCWEPNSWHSWVRTSQFTHWNQLFWFMCFGGRFQVATVGYGDITPKTMIGQLIAIVTIIAALTILPLQIGRITALAYRRSVTGAFDVLLWKKEAKRDVIPCLALCVYIRLHETRLGMLHVLEKKLRRLWS